MQKIAAYLLERRDGMNWPEARISEVELIKAKINDWLSSKGADRNTGTYVPQDESHGTFMVDEATDGDRSWWMVKLEEVDAGRKFTTAISVTNCQGLVAVYVSMELGSKTTTINPVDSNPRCPRVIRKLLELQGKWFHGKSLLLDKRIVKGFDEGQSLVEEIKNPERSIPLVVISQDDKCNIVPTGLDSGLAYDLLGLANVIVVDRDAAWALTDGLRQRLSCYMGATRLYWPKLTLADNPLWYPLWTATQLQSAGTASETLEKLRRQLRNRVMRASALGIVRPTAIDEIRTAYSRRVFAEMKNKATTSQDFEKLADEYAKENDALLTANKELKSKFDDARAQIAQLEVQLRYKEEQVEEIAPETTTADAFKPPQSGDVRFYKKQRSAPDHDIMLRVPSCNHNNWQSGHAGDKAKKGIAKLEEGRSDWKSLHHCGPCTGGGMWRVKW